MPIYVCRQSDCLSEFQDKRYGRGKRVHTGTSNTKEQCTVCGNTRSATSSEKKK